MSRNCVLKNEGITIKYFKLGKGARQGKPASAYLFFTLFRDAFMLIKTTKNQVY